MSILLLAHEVMKALPPAISAELPPAALLSAIEEAKLAKNSLEVRNIRISSDYIVSRIIGVLPVNPHSTTDNRPEIARHIWAALEVTDTRKCEVCGEPLSKYSLDRYSDSLCGSYCAGRLQGRKDPK